MRLLHIISSLDDGGAEAVLYRLISCDTSAKNSHSVISLRGTGKYHDLLEREGISVICLSFSSFLSIPTQFLRLVFAILAVKPDVVQTWMYHSDFFGGIAARLCGVKRVVWGLHHTNLIVGKSKRSTIFIARLCALLSWFVPIRIISCSKAAKLVHIELGYDESKIEFIPNGYDLNDFSFSQTQRDELRAEFGVRDCEFLIGTVGRFSAQKDHVNLLKALSFLKGQGILFRCLLVGSNLDYSNSIIVDNISRLDLHANVILAGARPDIPRIMSGLDIHVLPSAFGEAFPNVVAESMACETPCVVTNVGDSAFIVGQTGWVVAPSDHVVLAGAIAHAKHAMMDASWAQRGLDARSRILNNFDVQLVLKKYLSVWEAQYA